MRYFALEVQAQKTADAIGAGAASAALSRLQANPNVNPGRVQKVKARLQAEQATTPTAQPAAAPMGGAAKPAAPEAVGAAVAKPAPAGAVAKPAGAGAVAKPAGAGAMVPYTAPKAFASNAAGPSPTASTPPKPGMGWGKGLALAGAGLAGAGLLASMHGERRDY